MSPTKPPVARFRPALGLVPGSAGAGDASIQIALLAAIVESSDDAIVSKTLDGRICSWNAGAARLFGYTADEIVGRPITVIIPEELRDEELGFIAKLKRGERIDHFDTIRLTKDGRRIPISLTISPVCDSTGRIVGASKVARDISERIRIEQLRRQSEAELAAEAAALGKLNDFSTRLWRCRNLEAGLREILASVIDLSGADKGTIELYDESTRALSVGAQRGFESSGLDALRAATADAGCGFGAAFDLGPRLIVEDIESDSNCEPMTACARLLGFRGLIATRLLRADGAMLGVLSVYFPTPLKSTEQELRRLEMCTRQAGEFIQRCATERALHEREEALRDADKRKDEFLALLAHELRNPLAPIRYALAVAKKAGRTPEQQRLGEEVIERQVAHMSRLLDDLLEVSRITRGTLDLKKTRTELMTVLGTAIESARPILDAKHHDLSLNLPKHAIAIEADAVRLAQVFSNLLINAAKYTDPGGRIELMVAEKGTEVVVTVRDNGIGISPETMPRLFTLFAQEQSALARSEGGLGVGLALVRGLVLLHGGHVEARSVGRGHGSEFLVHLPVGAETSEHRGTAATSTDGHRGPALRILVVDDSRDAADMCAALLALSGHTVQCAYSGRQGIAVAEAFRPHVLLLDIGLPDMNGYELATEIRATPWGHEPTLVAITGWGQAEDRRRAIDAGFDHHLTKPVAPEAVLELLGSAEPLSNSGVSTLT